MNLGELLKTARTKKNLTVEQVADKTRVRHSYIRAFESEIFDGLPADVYSKGFLKIYAEFLGLNQDEMVELYMKQRYPKPKMMQQVRQGPVDVAKTIDGKMILKEFHRRAKSKFMLLFGLFAVSFLIFSMVFPSKYLSYSMPVAKTPNYNDDILRIRVFAKQNTWVRVRLNNQIEYQGIIRKDKAKYWKVEDKDFKLKTGNPRGIAVSINGQYVNILKGPKEDAKTVKINKNNLSEWLN
ncbi:helix-turn-helix domain-containing protein [bacterium]